MQNIEEIKLQICDVCHKMWQLGWVAANDGNVSARLEDGRVIAPSPKGKSIWGSVTINERGQVVIPKAAREQFNLVPGQRLILLSEVGEGYALVPAEIFERRMEEMTKLVSSKL